MSTRWFGERVLRSEDERLLRGRGLYTDDLDQGALHACFVRSPYAHARTLGIDAYPVQRQRLPAMPSSISCAVGSGCCRSSPTTDSTKPGVQKPHCRP